MNFSHPLIEDSAFKAYQSARVEHWEATARLMAGWKGWGNQYHKRLRQIYRYLVSPGQRVIEIGCGTGDLLASVEPAYGVGVDFSEEMLAMARQRNPQCHYVLADAHDLEDIHETFDVIILSDLLNDLWDVQLVLKQLTRLSSPRTRLITNNYSRLWEQPLAIAAKSGLAKPVLFQNWLTVEDIKNILDLAHFEYIRHFAEILLPLPIPVLEPICNRLLVKMWPFYNFALTNFIIARPHPRLRESRNGAEPSVSVIIPARNEAGNINAAFDRTPNMGADTELIFVEGHSKDDTYSTIKKAIKEHPQRKSKVFQQTGVGKGDAVRLGFSKASGDILIILDADLTMPPEDLPRYFEVLRSGKGEFVNGVRLVYPMEKQAMRFLNLIGNKFFSNAFSWLLGQSVKDTLCGTKVLWRSDYEHIAANRSYFGDFDPFGDFDLLFGASKLNLKIIDLPIRYRERTYGNTNIQRWKHGWLLLKMVWFAAGRIKFI
jgi:ubiquinone/menaquinone biosynthesis C-methylase UbiE